jgi:hypothetical protein
MYQPIFIGGLQIVTCSIRPTPRVTTNKGGKYEKLDGETDYEKILYKRNGRYGCRDGFDPEHALEC